MLYLPTCMVILQTSHEKGSFQIRSSVLFWNSCILWRATVQGHYLLDFFTWSVCKNSFWGALPPIVGQSFLWAGSSPPKLRWPSLHSHLDQLLGEWWQWWLSPPLQLLYFFHLLLHHFCPWWSLFNWGWGMNWRGEPSSFFYPYHPHCPWL